VADDGSPEFASLYEAVQNGSTVRRLE